MSGRARRWFRIGLRAVVHALCLPVPPSAPRVLLWHSLDRTGGPISLAPELFQRQVAWLARRGYRAWSAGRYAEALAAREPLPARLVVLTFDDGYANTVREGGPALRAHGLSATVFLVTGQMGRKPGWMAASRRDVSGRLLTWDEARNAAGGEFAFESHTHAHAALPGLAAAEIREELARSGQELAERGLGRGRVVAWPYGAYEPRLAPLAREQGYAAGFIDEFRWSHRDNRDLFGLNRVAVDPDLGVFGIAFAMGKGIEVWSWMRERLGRR